MKDGVDGMKISSGTAASGEPDQSFEQGCFAGDAFLKTNGDNPSSGYTCVVTENPPEKYAGSEPKKTSYTVDLDEATDHRDNWKEDTAWTAELNAAGYLVDWLDKLKNTPAEVAGALNGAVANAPATAGGTVNLAKMVPVNLSKTAQTVAESQKQLAKATEQAASAAQNSKSWWRALPVLGTALQAVGVQRTIDSWYTTSGKLGVLEAEDSQNYVESQYGWLMLNAGAAATLCIMVIRQRS